MVLPSGSEKIIFFMIICFVIAFIFVLATSFMIFKEKDEVIPKNCVKTALMVKTPSGYKYVLDCSVKDKKLVKQP